MAGDFSGYINLGLQGVGRISASQLDAFGETFGSVSGLQITNWKASNGSYTGSFLTLPDRGYNSGAVYSDYRARVQQVDFSFTPYTGSTALSSTVNQMSLKYMGGSLLTINDGPANTTGALPTTSAALQIGTLTTGTVPKTAGGKISFDAEGLALFSDGSGYVTDEYGPNIYYIQNGNITSVINPPASAMPSAASGSLTYTVSGSSAADPTTGRRGNQGMEAVAISPDGRTLFTMLQSATMQDSTSGSQNRQYARLYKYDVSSSRSNPTLLAEYVVELPRFNDTSATQTGLTPNKTGAQSEMVALDGDRIMLLSRDSNGNGIATSTPAVFKSVMIADLTKGGTNILSQDTSSSFTVKNGTVSTSISGDFTTKLKDGITAVSPVQFVSIIDATQLAKFGLNTNDGSTAARTSATISEKWEGMALVSALDASKPNDYFLFVANDNDFLTTKLKMKSTDGTTVTTAGSLGLSVENDTMFLAYRVTLPLGASDTTLGNLSLSSTPSQAASIVVDGGSTLSSGSSTYDISATTVLVPGSLTITRPIDVGIDGGALNLLGNKVVLSGSVSGTGALTVFGTSSASALTLSGTNTYSGGTEVNATKLQVSAASNLGTGQINLNAGATLALTQSGSFSNAAGYYVGGGTMEVASGKGVVWNGSLTGVGLLTKSGAGSLELKGSSTGFSGGVYVTAGSLSVGSGTTTWSAGSGSLSLSSGARLNVLMSGTVDLTNKITAVPSSSIYWTGTDSSSVLKLNTTIPKIYNTNNVGSISLGMTGKTLIYANGLYYQPFTAGLAIGTPVYMDAEGSLLNATQRSLGYREVAYKNLFFQSLGFTSATTSTDADGNTIYNYGSPSTSSNLVGYWTKKNLPIIIGPDGKGYITDGHHTTAGYLASGGTAIIAGKNHIVLGTIVSNPSSQTSVNDQMWTDFANSNNAYLYGTNGNQLIQPGETQGTTNYSGLQPILPTAGGVAMPTTPGTASMTNDLYRSLTWGMADGIVKTATNVSGTKLPGYLKLDPNSATGADVNFIEFYWSDFLRQRVVWNDNAAVTSPNLINAPVSFFAAVANGNALAKSELYVDQFGRSLTDYTSSIYSANTQNWANATLKNGLAVAGDTYNLFLTDDSTIQGSILASAVDGVVSNLNINTGTGMTVAGALQNFTSISINTGGSITIDWKDSSVNALTQNKTLTVASGSANVIFSGDNDYSKLSSLVVGAGTLNLNTANQTVDQTIWADISGSGSIRKTGAEQLTLTGANTFSGGLSLEEGKLVLGSPSVTVGGVLISSAAGKGAISVKAGATLGFDESVLLPNAIRFNAGSVSDALTTVDLGDNAVEFSGTVSAAVPLTVLGSTNSVLTLSGSGSLTGDLSVQSSLIRLNGGLSIGAGTINLRSGAGIQAGVNQAVSSSIVVEDEARLDGGESVLTINGDISGYGTLRITGHPFGTIRLGGVNSYTGGTTVEGTRVDVAVNSADDNNDGLYGSGRVFGTSAVTFTNATLGFTTSAQIPNALLLDTELTVDVGSNTAELSGVVSDSGFGTGGLYVKGNNDGALFLSGASNAYSGITLVEGTTLRLLHTADTSVLGVGTLASGSLLAIELNNARLQIVPNYAADATLSTTPVTSRNITIGALGATLDATDASINWSGVIAGGVGATVGKLTVTGNNGTQVELSGVNTYPGGTSLEGGVTLAFSSNSNLGNASGSVQFSDGALVYVGTSDLAFSRPLQVLGNAVFDTGSQKTTLTSVVTGGGSLEIGRMSQSTLDSNGSLTVTRALTAGSVIISGSGVAGFSGNLVAAAGTLVIGNKDAVRSATLVTVINGGNVLFTGSSATLGGLAGSGGLPLPSGFALSVGTNNASSYYSGVISGSASFSKVGSGNLTLGGSNLFSGNTTIAKGSLTIDTGASLASGTVSLLSGGASLVINTGSIDLSTRLDTSSLSATDKASTNIIYRGTGTLTLASNILDKVTVLNLGQGLIKVGTVTITGGTGASVTNSIGAGSNLSLPSLDTKVRLGAGSTFTLAPTDGGTPELKGSFLSGESGTTVAIPLGVTALMKEAAPDFKGALQANGNINVAPSAPGTKMALPSMEGTGKLAISSGSVQLVQSTGFTGTVSLASGAAAELTGSFGTGGTIALEAGGKMTINPADVSATMSVPKLTGGGSVALSAGKVNFAGGNSDFTGMIMIAKGVEATISGDLPSGTVTMNDSTIPLTVSSGSGSISFPGTVSGIGTLSLSGNGTVTMGSSASIATTGLQIGKTSGEKPTLDVTSLSGGSLTLTASQTLSGGGTLVGSVVTSGVFSPGNSPGTFTVASKTTGTTTTGGDLTIGSTGSVVIEYGVNSPSTTVISDQVVVAGTLTFASGSTVLIRPYGSFVTVGTTFSNVFSAASIVGTPSVSLETTSFLLNGTLTGNSTALALTISKTAYGNAVTNAKVQGIGNYLSTASALSPSAGLTAVLSALDVSANAAALEASLTSLNGQVYAEAQRLSLRRTAAISEALQGHLTAFPEGDHDGWAAWSESYVWGIHRDSTSGYGSWNGTNAGEILGVQHTHKGLSLGVFGATGYSDASFSSSSVKGDSFHGGMYAHIEAGMPFFDVSWLAGSVDQKSARSVSVGNYATSTSAKFRSSEYAVHLRGGLNIPNVAGSYLVKPSVALLCNGYSQNGVSESTGDGAALTTDRVSKSAWQSRLGSEISRSFKAGTKPAALLASAYWIHDFDRAARSVNTRFSGASSAAGSYTTSGDAFGADGFELGLGASVALSPRTSARLNGSWQIRDGSNQPGVNLGLTVQF